MSEGSLEQDMDRLEDLLSQAGRITGGPRSTTNGSATVQINAGGVAVWVAATACAVALSVSLFSGVVLGLLYVDHSRKIDTLSDYVSAIYMQAPHLKPDEEEATP